jgi:phosphatidylinositol alpha-1,6-mannosyltransferase
VALVVNNFPPVRGGSAVVYASLARCAPGRIVVVAPRINYADGLPVIGWREHDRRQPYRVIRLSLLRTIMSSRAPSGPRKLAFLLLDAAIRVRLAGLLLWLVARHGVRAICVGEMSASGWLSRLFAAVPGVRTIVYVHGEEITTEDLYDQGHRRARRALLANDRVVVVSRFTERAVAELLGPPGRGRVTLIENGVDGERFTPRPPAPDLMELYGLTGCFVFVSVCRLLEKKGVDQALRAFAQVLRHAADSRYVIVGGGPYRAALEALAESLALGHAVVFAGQVADDELVDHYRLGQVFVMPNRELANGDTEGFGLVFLEANSCGLPVIAGQDGGSTDAVRDGVNGLVVDGRSVEAIAAAMLRLRQDGGLRDTLRRQGLAVAAAAGWTGKTEAFLRLCGV